MLHGLNEAHITPCTDIEFQLRKYQTYIIISTNHYLCRTAKVMFITDIQRNCHPIDNHKTSSNDNFYQQNDFIVF